MPNAYDDFVLQVVGAIAANIFATTDTESIGSGEQFTIIFSYVGGFNPVATQFSVNWYGNATHREEQGNLPAAAANALSGSEAPTNVTFSPATPRGGTFERDGHLRGTAPTLGRGVILDELYVRLMIVQAALAV